MPFLEDQLEDSFFEAYNAGREAAASGSDMTNGVWSAIIDGGECDFCAWADGRTFRLGEAHLVPPAHFGCRCLIAYYTPDMLEEDEEGEQVFLPWEDPPADVFPFGSKKGNK